MEHLEFMLDLANSDAANGASAIKNWQPNSELHEARRNTIAVAGMLLIEHTKRFLWPWTLGEPQLGLPHFVRYGQAKWLVVHWVG